MTGDTPAPRVIDVWGPTLTPERAIQLTASVAEALGFELSAEEISYLHERARSISINRCAFAPVSGRSYKAVEDLGKAAWKLRTAIRMVQEVAAEPWVLERENIAYVYVDEIGMVEGDDEEEALLIDTPEDIINRVLNDVQLLERRANRALSGSRRLTHGQGRLIEGYDEFVATCQKVWSRHRVDQGWSERRGRGCGPFVRFVYLAQDLLAPPMRKQSEEAAGDAVVLTMKGTK
jgi:hypothetical protein